MDAALQAIQQAPDPSAAVTAYANGFALDRNNPKLYDAYVTRMVDLGLPEMAYHQAQTLTTLQSNNGLAWGVVAYVEARRAQMPEAISAINLAGQYAPDHKFVQHTAGELAAWYDFKADKGTIPQNTKDGLTQLRRLMEQRPVFTEAYTTAQKAYQSSAGATSPPSSAAPGTSAPAAAAPSAVAPAPAVPNAPEVPMAPQVQGPDVYSYSTPPPVPSYYPDYSGAYYPASYDAGYLGWGPDYYYGYGPGWVSPAPWWWWQPCGYWGGPFFYPFGFVFAFDCDNHNHHGHGHDGHSGHHDQFAHNGTHNGDPAHWHNGSHGQNHFFGSPAHASDSVTHAVQATAVAARTTAPSRTVATTSARWWTAPSHAASLGRAGATGAVRPAPTTIVNGSPANSSRTLGSTTVTRGTQQGFVNRSPGTTFNSPGSSGVLHGSPQSFVNRSPSASAPVARPWTGNPNVSRVAPSTSGSWPGRNAWAPNSAVPRSSWSVPGSSYRSPAYSSAPRFSTPSGSYGGWRGSSGMSAAPRSFGGFSGGRSSGAGSFGGGFHSGGAVGGGFHSGGGAMSGGGHGGGGGGGGHR